jgi:hypothetical protein
LLLLPLLLPLLLLEGQEAVAAVAALDRFRDSPPPHLNLVPKLLVARLYARKKPVHLLRFLLLLLLLLLNLQLHLLLRSWRWQLDQVACSARNNTLATATAAGERGRGVKKPESSFSHSNGAHQQGL